MRLVSALLVGALAGGTGCVRTHIVPADELRKLDGLGMPQPPPPPPPPGQTLVKREYRVLRGADGSAVEFDLGMDLFLQSAGGTSGGRFSRILVAGSAFEGVLARGARPVRVELGSVQYAQVRTVDGLATSAVVGGSIVLSLAGLYLLAVALNARPIP